MILRKIAFTAFASLLSFFPSAAFAKGDRPSEIAGVATICDAMSTQPLQIAETLRANGWKVATPILGVMSMAAITGSEQYRKGRDDALISGRASIVGANCQFDFAKASDLLRADVQVRLTAQFGEPSEIKQDRVTWKKGSVSYNLVRRSPDTLTILWLLEAKATN